MECVKSIFRSLYPSASENDIRFEPFIREEDGSEYSVWKITCRNKAFVLKKAKGREIDIYSSLLCDIEYGAPKLLGITDFEGERYFAIEYIEGRAMLYCDRASVVKALDALIALQERFWGCENDIASLYEESLVHRKKRGEYITLPELSSCYEDYMTAYRTLPRTLCHDDLLPFNVLVSENSASLIDWETAGILPYPTSLARLLAHTEETDDAFFFMAESDREYAINYYYDNFVKKKDISYEEYRHSLDLFIFYEYCEWIMLGEKCGDRNSERYVKYLKAAREFILKNTSEAM